VVRDLKSVLGMDLATRESGFCFIPAGWDGDFGALKFDGVGYDLLGKIPERSKLHAMMNAAKVAIRMIRQYEPDVLAVEDYAFSRQSSSTTMQAEIGGVVKSQILLGLDLVPGKVASTGARKFLTGGLRGKRKGDVEAGIKALPSKQQVKNFLNNRGMVFDTDDQMDAFVVAYYTYCVVNEIQCRFTPIEEHEQIGRRRKNR